MAKAIDHIDAKECYTSLRSLPGQIAPRDARQIACPFNNSRQKFCSLLQNGAWNSRVRHCTDSFQHESSRIFRTSVRYASSGLTSGIAKGGQPFAWGAGLCPASLFPRVASGDAPKRGFCGDTPHPSSDAALPPPPLSRIFVSKIRDDSCLSYNFRSAAGLKRYRRAGRWVPSIFFTPVSSKIPVARILLRKFRLSNLLWRMIS